MLRIKDKVEGLSNLGLNAFAVGAGDEEVSANGASSVADRRVGESKVCTTAILEDQNNTMIFLWQIYSIFFANIFYCFSPPTWPPCTHSIGICCLGVTKGNRRYSFAFRSIFRRIDKCAFRSGWISSVNNVSD